MAEERESTTTTSYKIFNVLGTILTWIVAIGIIIAALVFAQSSSPTKSIFGYRYYTVLTASMEPELSVGDVIIVKMVDADEIEVGDVITFNPSSDSEAYLTHRVTEKIEDYEGSGVTCFRTKGDANDDDDSFLIDENRVIGVVTVHIPILGYIIRFIQLRWYYVIPLVILIFVFIKLMKLYFESDDDDEKEEPTSEVSTAKESGVKSSVMPSSGKDPPGKS